MVSPFVRSRELLSHSLDDAARLAVAPQIKAILPELTQKTTARRCCIGLLLY